MFSLRDAGNVSDVKFLGMNLDLKLKWNMHIDNLEKKLARGLFILRVLTKNVSCDILMTLYYAIFHSHLTYALLVWEHSAETEL